MYTMARKTFCYDKNGVSINGGDIDKKFGRFDSYSVFKLFPRDEYRHFEYK